MGRHGTIAGRKAAQDSKRAAMFTEYAQSYNSSGKGREEILTTILD